MYKYNDFNSLCYCYLCELVDNLYVDAEYVNVVTDIRPHSFNINAPILYGYTCLLQTCKEHFFRPTSVKA